jgi:hypothetical protein
MISLPYKWCMRVYVCLSLYLPIVTRYHSVKTFLQQQRIGGGNVFYAACIVSKESWWLCLTRTACSVTLSLYAVTWWRQKLQSWIYFVTYVPLFYDNPRMGKLTRLNYSSIKSTALILSGSIGVVTYKEMWGLDWLLDLLDTQVNYNLQSSSISHTQQFTIHALSPPGLLSLHQSSGTGFQWQTFPFLGSQTVPTPQPLDSWFTVHSLTPSRTASSCNLSTTWLHNSGWVK